MKWKLQGQAKISLRSARVLKLISILIGIQFVRLAMARLFVVCKLRGIKAAHCTFCSSLVVTMLHSQLTVGCPQRIAHYKTCHKNIAGNLVRRGKIWFLFVNSIYLCPQCNLSQFAFIKSVGLGEILLNLWFPITNSANFLHILQCRELITHIG